MVKLFCAIVGVVGSVFEVEIDEGASVSALKKVIKGEKPNDLKDIDANKLQLFLAKTDGAWLDGAGAAAVALDERGYPQGCVQMDPTLWIKNPKHFGDNFQPGEGQIHVLVVVPEQEHAQTGLWLVTGSVDNALDTRGTRCKLYWMAKLRIGYYDPARRIDNKDVAFWYESKKLCFHVLFETSTCFIYRRCDVL
ncbi:Crinkler effector protein 4 [Phytophthora ramorum]|nr:Crinkler effector protein BLC01 [Phytophthora ramorum]